MPYCCRQSLLRTVASGMAFGAGFAASSVVIGLFLKSVVVMRAKPPAAAATRPTTDATPPTVHLPEQP